MVNFLEIDGILREKFFTMQNGNEMKGQGSNDLSRRLES